MLRNINTERQKTFNNRMKVFKILFVGVCVSLAVYLATVQIFDIRHYRDKAKSQRSSKKFVMRGVILDRNGVKLASDSLSYNVYIHRQYLDHTPEELAKKLAPVVGVSEQSIINSMKSQSSLILVKKGVDRYTADQILHLRLREVSLDKKNNRVYPQEKLASHILGYYNSNADVASGIEQTMKDKLAAPTEDVFLERTGKGDVIYDFGTDPAKITAPTVGQTVVLTIDAAIQHVCETELMKMITEKKALRGTVIVMNPNNGEILGYAVYPDYDPNKIEEASFNQIKNWTLTDVYPPGSTFKVLTVASAVQNGKIERNTTVLDTGKAEIGGWTIKNYDYDKFPYPGDIDMIYLFRHSSNIGSVKVAYLMTPREFYTSLEKFGIGSKTGIDLPGESSGLLPDPRTWDISRHASMGYGYGASVTAIQMVSAVAAIANDGIRITPHVIKYSEKELPKHVKRTKVMEPMQARLVTDFLYLSNGQSPTPVNLKDYHVAAKTGTSRKTMEGSKGYTNQLFTSVVGYFPATNPEVLIYVVVDSAQGGAVWGSTVAAPVFAEVAKQVARIMHIKPDKGPGTVQPTRPLPEPEKEPGLVEKVSQKMENKSFFEIIADLFGIKKNNGNKQK